MSEGRKEQETGAVSAVMPALYWSVITMKGLIKAIYSTVKLPYMLTNTE